MELYYTGIGSRETPKEILDIMHSIADKLPYVGYTLRSGGAEGADSAFEEWCIGKKEIYLPWNGYNGKHEDGKEYFVYKETEETYQVVKDNHQFWYCLSPGARKLIGRDYLELVGNNGVKSKFVIGWTDYEEGSGGTAYTFRLARKLGIPVYNLRDVSFDEIWDKEIALEGYERWRDKEELHEQKDNG